MTTGEDAVSQIKPLLEVLITPSAPTATKYSAPNATLLRSERVEENLLVNASVVTPVATNIDPAAPTATQLSVTLEYTISLNDPCTHYLLDQQHQNQEEQHLLSEEFVPKLK